MTRRSSANTFVELAPTSPVFRAKTAFITTQVAHYVRNSEGFGITAEDFSVKMAAVRERKRRMVQGLVDTHLDLYHRSRAELIMATGRFSGLRTLEATLSDGTKRLLRGTNVVIGTGTPSSLCLVLAAPPVSSLRGRECRSWGRDRGCLCISLDKYRRCDSAGCHCPARPPDRS